MLCFSLSPEICVLKAFLPPISLLSEWLHGWKQPGSSFPHSQSHTEQIILVPSCCRVASSGLAAGAARAAPGPGAVPEPEAALPPRSLPQHPGNSQQEKPAAASCRSICFDCLFFIFFFFPPPGCCSLPFCRGDSLPGARRQLERAQGNHGATVPVGYLHPRGAFSVCPLQGGTIPRGGAWGNHHARLGTAVG